MAIKDAVESPFGTACSAWGERYWSSRYPSALDATAFSDEQIDLSWTNNGVADYDGICVERGTDGINFLEIDVLGIVSSYSDTDSILVEGTKYYYRIRYYKSAGYSDYSNVADECTLPLAPSDLILSVIATNQINISFTINSSNAGGHIIERSADGVNYSEVITLYGSDATYNNTGLIEATTYYYRVRAFKEVSYSAYCTPVVASTIPLAPSVLAGVSASVSTVELTWVDNSTGEDGYSIERSTDQSTWVEIDTVSAGVEAYTDTSLLTGTTYYYRVRAFLSTTYSAYSNTISVDTLYGFQLTPTGAGTGVAVIRIESSAELIISLSGAGRFYSDEAGTLNESSTWTVTAGTLWDRYIRVPSGTSRITFNYLSRVIRWGDVVNRGWDGVGDYPSISGSNFLFPNCQTAQIYGNNTLSFNVSTLSAAMTVFRCEGQNTITGTMADIPATLTTLILYGSNTFSGNLSDIPANIITLGLDGANTVTGDIANIPASCTSLIILGNNTTYGALGDLKVALTELELKGNSFTGDTSDIPANMVHLLITGANAITGDIADIPATMTYFLLFGGSNPLSGDVANLPAVMEEFGVDGSGVTITGDLADLPAGLTRLTLQGSNTIYGEIANIPAGVYYLSILGNNVISGDLADISTTMKLFDLEGLNTVSTYSSPHVFSDRLYQFIHIPVTDSGSGLSTTEIDNLLIDLAASDWEYSTGVPTGTLTLTGGNAARSSASDVAVATLEGKNVTVLVDGGESSIDIDPYWITNLYGTDDLVLETSGRDGNKLPAFDSSGGSDADILLPYFYNSDTMNYRHLDTTGAFDIATDFSVGIWFKYEGVGLPAVNEYLVGKNEGGAGWCVSVETSGSAYFQITTSGGAGIFYCGAAVNLLDNNWHFFVVTLNITSKQLNCYIDGVFNSNGYSPTTYVGDPTTPGGVKNFDVGRHPVNIEYCHCSYSDIYVYNLELSAAQVTTLFNRGIVAGALAHWAYPGPESDYIVDCSNNGYELTANVACELGFCEYGSQHGLNIGYDVYDVLYHPVYYLPKTDAGQLLTNWTNSYTRTRKKDVAGNASNHNLAWSYIRVNDNTWDRSNTTIWSAAARGATYIVAEPKAWLISELHRLNLYEWANVGYKGLCFVKMSVNSFGLKSYLSELIGYGTNKDASEILNVVLYTNDYQGELLQDIGFISPYRDAIWWHPWDNFNISDGKASYDALDDGCIRQYLDGCLIPGRTYKLRYTISNAASGAWIFFSGNGGLIFAEWEAFQLKANGVYEETVTGNAIMPDVWFEVQATNDFGGTFDISDISLKLIETI